MPAFERNEDTLKTLLALGSANEKADEERDLLWSIQKEALAELQNEGKGDELNTRSNAVVVGKLSRALDARGQEDLEAISGLAVVVDAATPETECVGKTVIALTETSHTLTQHLLRLTHLQRRLESELQSLKGQLQQLRSPAFQPPMSLSRQTVDWNRNTKQLRAKLEEYTSRLSVLAADNMAGTNGGALIEEIAERERVLEELRDRLGGLEEQVKVFQGLPNDIDGARKEIERAKGELAGLQRRRDKLFEGLVEAG